MNRGIKFLNAASVAIFILSFASGCFYDQVLPEEPDIPVGDVSFAQDVQPIFNDNCVQCHSGSGLPLNLSPGVSYGELTNGGYVNTADPQNSLIIVKLSPGGSMEQNATASEKAVILKWIEQGALNN